MAMTFLYYTAYTVFMVPWGALGLELTTDYNERTRVQAYRTVFQAVGGLGLGTMWVLAQKCGGGNDVVGVRFQRENLPVQSRRPSISADDFAIRSDHFLQFLTIIGRRR